MRTRQSKDYLYIGKINRTGEDIVKYVDEKPYLQH